MTKTIKKSMSKLLLAALVAAFASGGAVLAQAQDEPVSVKDTIDLTIKNNPNLKAFQEYRQAAEFDRKRARSGFLPTLNASGGIGFEQWDNASTRPSNANRRQNNRDFYSRADSSVVLSQNIWDGFAAWSRYRMTDAMLTSAEHRLFDNAEALALDAILAHMEICRQEKNGRALPAQRREPQTHSGLPG